MTLDVGHPLVVRQGDHRPTGDRDADGRGHPRRLGHRIDGQIDLLEHHSSSGPPVSPAPLSGAPLSADP